MLVLGRIALSRGVDLKINWLGRWGVWPVFGALFFAICDVHWLATACLYVGLALALAASAKYVHDGLMILRAQGSTSA
jgi:cardiolipin synthase